MMARAVGLLLLGLLGIVQTHGRRPDDNFSNCRSQDGFEFESAPPMYKSKSSSSPLIHCFQYNRNTCCNTTHTAVIKRQVLTYAVASFSSGCRDSMEQALCSVCDPDVGVGRITETCQHTCDKWFEACKNDFYTPGLNGDVLPCMDDSLVCSPLSDIVSDGAQFCSLLGRRVSSPGNSEGPRVCFDGVIPKRKGKKEPDAAESPELGGWGDVGGFVAIFLCVILVMVFTGGQSPPDDSYDDLRLRAARQAEAVALARERMQQGYDEHQLHQRKTTMD